MDTPPPIAAVAAQPVPATPPWVTGADEAPAPPPISSRPMERRKRVDGVHWSVTALTIVTAIVLVFGSWRGDDAPSRVMTWSAHAPGD